MKFSHEVKHNGVYYPAGTDVPIGTKSEGVAAPAPLVSGKDTNEKSKKYSEDDFKGMKYFSLKALAKQEGFDVPNNASSDEVRKMLLSIEV